MLDYPPSDDFGIDKQFQSNKQVNYMIRFRCWIFPIPTSLILN
jgi:hypothetical protein